MLVRTGINSDYARKKFDVEVDDVHDLPAMLAEVGLPPDYQMTNWYKFQLLTTEAQLLCWSGAVSSGIVPPEEGNSQVQTLASARKMLLDQLLPQPQGGQPA